MKEVLKILLDKILEFTKKKEGLDQEFELKLHQGKSIDVEFQKRRTNVDGQLLAYKDSAKIVKKQINNTYNDSNVDMVKINELN